MKPTAKLNLGCGLDIREGYINIDIRKVQEGWKAISFWVYGTRDYETNLHKSGFTIPTLKKLLESIGFIVERIENDGDTNAVAIVIKP
jgi:hypothetical protein